MKNCALLCVMLVSLCSLIRAQEIEIKIKEVYRKTITPDYTRYEYVFSITNNTPNRLNVFVDVSLLDAQKKIVDTRFLDFQTPEGVTETGSIESDYPPAAAGASGIAALFYRLSVRDDVQLKTYQKEGEIKVPVIHKQG
jgi:hypothetical protein